MIDTAPNLEGVTPAAIIAGQEIQRMIASGSPGCDPDEILKMADNNEEAARLARIVSENHKPPGWKRKLCLSDGAMFEDNKGRRIIVSVMTCSDGKKWIHASISHKKATKIPHYDEVAMLKRFWIGDQFKAVMVFPERDYHVNIRNNVLHIFSCLGDNPLPEFSGGGSI